VGTFGAGDDTMEIEFKFNISPKRLAAVKAAARRGASKAIRLEARYFDTPDKALSSRGIALRLRKEGDQWVQTVKAMGDGPLDREEHNVTVARPGRLARPELHAGTPAGSRLRAALEGATGPLKETYRTEIERVTRDLAFRGGVVELALDTGAIIAYRGTPQEKQAPVCEVELELKEGAVTGLVQVAAEWAAQYELVVNTVSKAERGERLMAAQWARPAAKARPLQARSARQFLKGPLLQRAVVANCLAQVLGNASEIVEGSGGPAHVHQLRVGIRRLRTALRELDGVAPGRFDPAWEGPLGDAFRSLGALRDREQVLEAIGAELRAAGAPAPGPRAALAPGSALDILRAPAFQAALIALMGFTAHTEPSEGGPGDGALGARKTRRALQGRLRALHAKVRKDAQAFETLPEEGQHRVRKRLKRLRYLAEFMEPVLAGGARGFLASLHPALDALGRLNDERVAGAAYREMAAADPGAWFGVGWLAARQGRSVKAAKKALARIAEAPGLVRL
jgi:inorganic triphosphatase YgiF